MNLRYIPFQAVGLASLAVIKTGDLCPVHARVVDLTVGRVARRMALDSPNSTRFRFSAAEGISEATVLLDELIAAAERRHEPGDHECGGA